MDETRPDAGDEPVVLGLDCSTTGAKAVAWDRTGRALAEARQGLELRKPQPDWHEQDAEDWWLGSAAALRELAAQLDPQRLAGLAISHQRESFVPVDGDGRPLRPGIVWMDERSRPLLPELAGMLGPARYHQLTGRPLSGNLTASKIFWLSRHEPDVYARTARYLDVHAFLVHRLTGEYRTSWGSADPTGLLDTAHLCWADEVLQGIGLRHDQLPTLHAPGERLGAITPAAAAICGLPAGLPVICGLGDGKAAGLGAGIVEPGSAYLNLGTAVVSGAYSADYSAAQAFRTTCCGIPHSYLLETVLLGGAYTLNWFVHDFLGLTGTGEHLRELEDAAASVPPGAGGLMLVPYWNSAMNPYWDAGASGVVVGWRGHHARQHLYRAIMEGIAFEQRLATAGVEAEIGAPVGTYIVMGGGSRSPLWRQIIADVTGKTVRQAVTAEASALGAGILAAAGCGLYPSVRAAAAGMLGKPGAPVTPDSERHAHYTRLYEEVYRHLFPALQTHLDRLTELSGAS